MTSFELYVIIIIILWLKWRAFHFLFYFLFHFLLFFFFFIFNYLAILKSLKYAVDVHVRMIEMLTVQHLHWKKVMNLMQHFLSNLWNFDDWPKKLIHPVRMKPKYYICPHEKRKPNQVCNYKGFWSKNQISFFFLTIHSSSAWTKVLKWHMSEW